MNSYLERLAASAINPGGTIHPVLRPVFAGTERRGAPVPLEWEEAVVSRDHPASLATTAPEASLSERPAAAPTERSHTDASTAPAQAGPLVPKPAGPPVSSPLPVRRASPAVAPPEVIVPPVEVPTVAPLPVPTISVERAKPIDDPPSISESFSAFARVATDATPRDASRVATPIIGSDLETDARREPGQRKKPGRVESAIVVEAYQPIVPGPARADTAPGIFNESADAPVSFVPKHRAAAIARRVARGTAGSRDEIQIHIGRIEVTAVPQAPTHAPPKPARKSVSLDEYLKRRDPRAL
jgi:hypothetical protein